MEPLAQEVAALKKRLAEVELALEKAQGGSSKPQESSLQAKSVDKQAGASSGGQSLLLLHPHPHPHLRLHLNPL
jgi:hypothetical protein